MRSQTNCPVPLSRQAGNRAFQNTQTHTIPAPKPGQARRKRVGKLERMLSIFADGNSLNTFEAARLSDTCLHSTISDIQSKHPLTFARRSEVVINRFGSGTRVTRYWLDGEHLAKAKALTSHINLNAPEN